MSKFTNWFKEHFGKKQEAAAPSQIPPQMRAGFTAPEMPSLEGNPLLSHEDVHKLLMSVSGNYNDDPRLETLIDDYVAYRSLFESKIPGKDDPEFAKKTAALNRQMMEVNEHLISSLSEVTLDYLQKSGQERRKENGNQELAERYEQMGAMLKKLAEHTLGQQTVITNTYDQVMETYRQAPNTLDVTETKAFGEMYRSTQIYQKAEAEGKKLGHGAMNTVYKVQVDGKDRVFKQGTGSIRSRDEYATDIEVYQDRLGSEIETRTLSDGSTQYVIKDVETAKRDAAVSRVDQLFGFGIAVGTRLGRSETGELSSLMEVSAGQEITKFALISDPSHERIVREYQANGYEDRIRMLQQAIESKKKNGESPDLIRANEEDLQMCLEEKETRSANPVICIRDSDLNKSLMEMAALDYICTHMDRHVGNYMIVQQDGKFRVQAIDNDTAFARVEEGRRGGPNAPEVNLEDNFPFVDAGLKAKIQAISPETLRDSLTGLLKEDQIAVACERLKKMQEHFEKVEVVTGDFTSDQIDRLLDPDKQATSYNSHLTRYTADRDKEVKVWVREQQEYYEILLPEEVASRKAIAAERERKEAEKLSFEQLSKEAAEKETAVKKPTGSVWKTATPIKAKEAEKEEPVKEPLEKKAPMIGGHRKPKA